MARSRHTDPPKVVADREDLRTGMARPRVLACRPRHGDIHPIPKNIVEALLVIVPSEYVHGMRRVELRAREADVGMPYAEYRRDEDVIIVYSVPTEWSRRFLPEYEQRSMRRFGAHLERRADSWVIQWQSLEGLGFWFAFTVLFHELGHHFADQYHRRKGRILGRPYREAFADATARRIYRSFRKRMKSRFRAGRVEPSQSAS